MKHKLLARIESGKLVILEFESDLNPHYLFRYLSAGRGLKMADLTLSAFVSESPGIQYFPDRLQILHNEDSIEIKKITMPG